MVSEAQEVFDFCEGKDLSGALLQPFDDTGGHIITSGEANFSAPWL